MKEVLMEVVPATPIPGIVRHRRTEPASESRRLAADIERAIRVRAGRTIHNLRVTVTKRHIVLAGNCSTYYAKQLAQTAAMPLMVDEELMNEIEVR